MKHILTGITASAMVLVQSSVWAMTPTPEPEPEPTPTEQLADGRYTFTNANSNKAITVAQASQNDGAQIFQQSYGGGSHQQWDIKKLSSGYYSVRAAHSGKAMDVYEWNSGDGADLRQWSYLEGDNQQWEIKPLDNGNYYFVSKFSAKSVSVANDSTQDGSNIILWSYQGNTSQQWRAERVGNTTPPSNTPGSSCQSTGSVTVRDTIVVSSGVYDGGCKTFNPTSALGDGGQAEGQKPVFRVENGATLKNVIIGNNGADGIHFYNGGTIDNIRWTDVGEDALTVKSAGDVTIRNIEGYDGYDKFMQINAASNITVENCLVDNMGKFLRQNGGTSFTVNVTVNNCQISNMKEAVFRTDSNTSTAHISNSRLRNYGQLCYGSWRSCTSSNITGF